MVNPYITSSTNKQVQAPKAQLSYSVALNRFEKFQAKNASNERRSASPNKNKFSLDSSSLDDDNSENDDDDSIINNAKKLSNKFIKQSSTQKTQEKSIVTKKEERKLSESETDISIKLERRSVTPKNSIRASSRQSVVSSVVSVSSAKRPQSKVKFAQDSLNDEESSLIEDLLSKNLLLDVNELESVSRSTSPNKSYKKKTKNRKEKKQKINYDKRAESVNSSIREEIQDQEENSKPEEQNSPSSRTSDSSLLNEHLIMDINELELNRDSSQKVKVLNKSLIQQNSIKSRENEPKKIKTIKNNKKIRDNNLFKVDSLDTSTPAEKMDTVETADEIDSASSIATQIESESGYAQKEKAKNKKNRVSSRLSTASELGDRRYELEAFESESKSIDRSAGLNRTKKFNKKQQKSARSAPRSTSDAEIQVDSGDLFKNSNLLKSINIYSPSAILLDMLAPKMSSDLNELNGYAMISRAFDETIKMNLNFMKNFLSAQRTFYEKQIESIQPKYY
jgi:hypothetical protein